MKKVCNFLVLTNCASVGANRVCSWLVSWFGSQQPLQSKGAVRYIATQTRFPSSPTNRTVWKVISLRVDHCKQSGRGQIYRSSNIIPKPLSLQRSPAELLDYLTRGVCLCDTIQIVLGLKETLTFSCQTRDGYVGSAVSRSCKLI